jgi:hypothetical protein
VFRRLMGRRGPGLLGKSVIDALAAAAGPPQRVATTRASAPGAVIAEQLCQLGAPCVSDVPLYIAGGASVASALARAPDATTTLR